MKAEADVLRRRGCRDNRCKGFPQEPNQSFSCALSSSNSYDSTWYDFTPQTLSREGRVSRTTFRREPDAYTGMVPI